MLIIMCGHQLLYFKESTLEQGFFFIEQGIWLYTNHKQLAAHKFLSHVGQI